MTSTTVSFVSKLSTHGSQPVNHMKHIVARDRARAQKLLAGLHPQGPLAMQELRKKKKSGSAPTPKPGSSAGHNSVDVTDSAVTYMMRVGVGSPATDYNLLIDTGSSNTWLGADKEYKPTSSSSTKRNKVSVSYGSGSFTGTEYTDTVSLSDTLTIQSQSIGVSTPAQAQGFNGTDGIIGIGPVDLTEGTVSGMPTVPTVTDNLLKQGTIQTEAIGIYYAPTTGDNLANGELTFGGVDESKITEPIQYVPITKTSPASHYWGVDQTMSYGDQEILSSTAGIVDTGTTLIMIASDAFQAYQKATGAVMDQQVGLLTITQEQFDNLQPLTFNIGNKPYSLNANAQIWPRAMNSSLGGDENKIYLVVADMGQESGQGLDFIDGFTFLQRFYSVYDTTNARVGFAPTALTDAETN